MRSGNAAGIEAVSSAAHDGRLWPAHGKPYAIGDGRQRHKAAQPARPAPAGADVNQARAPDVAQAPGRLGIGAGNAQPGQYLDFAGFHVLGILLAGFMVPALGMQRAMH